MRGPIKSQTLAVLRQRQVPVGVVLDVGVLTGTPELIEAYPDRMHVLFEPVLEFTAQIHQTYRNVWHLLVQAAVSDRVGTTALQTTTVMSGMQISHSSMVDEAGVATRIVPMITLDHYLDGANLPAPYLVKVDVDGFEMRVLTGAAETLKNTSIVIVEATVDAIAERIAFLTQRGFRLFDLTEPCYYDESLWQCDAVFIRNDLYAAHFMTIDRGFDESKYTAFNLRLSG